MIEVHLPANGHHYQERVLACLSAVPHGAVVEKLPPTELLFVVATDDACADPAMIALSRRTPVVRISISSEDRLEAAYNACTNYSVEHNQRAITECIVAAALRAHALGGNAVLTMSIDEERSGGRISPHTAMLQKRVRGVSVYEQWHMGIGLLLQPDAIDTLHLFDNITWLRTPKDGTFTADPFVIRQDSRTIIVYEFLDHDGKGRIHARVFEQGQEIVDRCILELPCHLSYPFVLRHHDKIYLIPESSGCRQTTAYTLDTTTLELEKAAVLFEDIGVVDPTLVLHDGTWYLLGCLAGVAENAALFIWYSESPFGPWKPHAMNPVKIDVASSRPAGQCIRDTQAQLLRPAQNSIARYGGGLTLNEIIVLTPSSFSERVQCELQPSPSWIARHGLHHFSHDNGAFVIDALQDRRSFHQFVQAIRR